MQNAGSVVGPIGKYRDVMLSHAKVGTNEEPFFPMTQIHLKRAAESSKNLGLGPNATLSKLLYCAKGS